jgi:hypothetical protein
MAASLHYMLVGGLVVGCAAVALFFFRFARDTRDRLFSCFGGAFAVLSVHWILLGIIGPTSEVRPFLYLIRLAAFLLILLGIVAKNRSTR